MESQECYLEVNDCFGSWTHPLHIPQSCHHHRKTRILLTYMEKTCDCFCSPAPRWDGLLQTFAMCTGKFPASRQCSIHTPVLLFTFTLHPLPTVAASSALVPDFTCSASNRIEECNLYCRPIPTPKEVKMFAEACSNK